MSWILLLLSAPTASHMTLFTTPPLLDLSRFRFTTLWGRRLYRASLFRRLLSRPHGVAGGRPESRMITWLCLSSQLFYFPHVALMMIFSAVPYMPLARPAAPPPPRIHCKSINKMPFEILQHTRAGRRRSPERAKTSLCIIRRLMDG